jgi:hypothetical protein
MPFPAGNSVGWNHGSADFIEIAGEPDSVIGPTSQISDVWRGVSQRLRPGDTSNGDMMVAIKGTYSYNSCPAQG